MDEIEEQKQEQLKQESLERMYYNWNLALLISTVLIALKVIECDSVENISWWWISLPLWLPFPLSLLISLIRKLF